MRTILRSTQSITATGPADEAAATAGRPSWAASIALDSTFGDGVVAVVSTSTPVPVECELTGTDAELSVVARQFDFVATGPGGPGAGHRELFVDLGPLVFTADQARAMAETVLSLLATVDGGAR